MALFLTFLAICALFHCVQSNDCQYSLVESIPEGVNFTSQDNDVQLPLIKDELISLVSQANFSIDVAEFYFTLKCLDVFNQTLDTCQYGERLLQTLVDAASRGVRVRIVVNGKRAQNMNPDLVLLENANASIRFVNFDSLVGGGVLHTKMMIFDGHKFFLGSANMDWRSLTQVKEIGIVTNKCKQLTEDLRKIFDIYWLLGIKKKIPARFPDYDATVYNINNPMQLNMNGVSTEVFLSSSPPQFCAAGRTNDIDALLYVINEAKHFLYLSVMDYAPLYLYDQKHAYWDTIDSALRNAVTSRGVQVKFILGYWTHTRPDILKFLSSLDQLRNVNIYKGSLEVRLFKVPITDPSQRQIPFARVDHAKFMVSDSHAFIGTSNWSADYFVNTGGVSIVASCGPSSNSIHSNQTDCIRDQLQSVFERDWASQYVFHLNHTRANQ